MNEQGKGQAAGAGPEGRSMELREQYRHALQAYSERIRPYLEVEVDNLKGTVQLHEPRWIAEGSGDIIWADGSNTRFYLSEGRIEPFDELPVLQEHLTALLELKRERDKALEKIMWGG